MNINLNSIQIVYKKDKEVKMQKKINKITQKKKKREEMVARNYNLSELYTRTKEFT